MYFRKVLNLREGWLETLSDMPLLISWAFVCASLCLFKILSIDDDFFFSSFIYWNKKKLLKSITNILLLPIFISYEPIIINTPRVSESMPLLLHFADSPKQWSLLPLSGAWKLQDNKTIIFVIYVNMCVYRKCSLGPKMSPTSST